MVMRRAMPGGRPSLLLNKYYLHLCTCSCSHLVDDAQQYTRKGLSGLLIDINQHHSFVLENLESDCLTISGKSTLKIPTIEVMPWNWYSSVYHEYISKPLMLPHALYKKAYVLEHALACVCHRSIVST